MASVSLYNQEGKSVGQVELSNKVFGLKPNRGLIEQAIVTTLTNRRQVLAHTLTKGEVRGGGRKPWRQKGTGRARHGSIRSPQWKGGGVIFGPRKNRNFEIKMNAAAKRKALLMSLSDKVLGERLAVIDGLKFEGPKTKMFAAMLKALPHKKTNLIVLPSTDMMVVKSARNIPGVTIIRADSLNTYDIVGHQQVFVLQEALPVIEKTFVKAAK